MIEKEKNKANIIKRLREIADTLEKNEYSVITLEMNNHMNKATRKTLYSPTGWNIYGQTWCLSTMPPIFSGDDDE